MKLILGIGNYGEEYEDTRHNSGYQVLDEFAYDCNILIIKHDFRSLVGKGKFNDEDVLLLKPLTYVNNSGDALIDAMNFYKLSIDDIYVLVDDMDTEVGHIRLRKKGSAGGHNGLKSIISVLHGDSNFKRIRIGIGKPEYNTIDFVLSSPKDKKEYSLWKEGISKAKEALEYALSNDFEKAMSKYNL